jgi:DNA invertase Pin-like site-specific DNA recombinase
MMNSESNQSVPTRPHSKVTNWHQERLAYVYVRQSTTKQMHHNQESQQYQYRLQQRAEELGWPPERIKVIDSDLGLSGRHADIRTGFQELVAEVSLGHVGIVFGYEVSRLARNNRDWYHLLDLAAMFKTLIADNDGIYDPRLYNDRLLLGLKGTMSEAELHWLRQRLDEGRMSQVKRGVYRQKLPTGLERLPDGTVVKHPDDQVRHVLDLLFAKFEELGSVTKVIRYFRQQNIQLPRRQSAGPHYNQILWKDASESAVTDTLKNPAYAGAFVYGRRRVDSSLCQPGRPATGRPRQPMEKWLHIQQDAYPAYISWEQYLANQERIRQNGLRFLELRQRAQGIEREGPGLLQGLAVCGHCSRHMQTVYKHTPRYVCRGLARVIDAPSTCNSVRAPVTDDVVVQAFFEAIQPAQLDVLEAILQEQQTEQQRLERQWQEQLKRVRYEAHLAQRQYDAVDPNNRLVAAELERRWEGKLHQLRQTEEAHHHFLQTPLPESIPLELRQQFQEVSQHLPEIWPSLKNSQKKQLLRSLISQVIIRRPTPDQIQLRIVWISGFYTDETAWTPIWRQTDVSNYDQMVERIRQLWLERYKDEEIAARLSAEGFHSARAKDVGPDTVMKIRLKNKWYLPLERIRRGEKLEGFLTVSQLTDRLNISYRRGYWLIHKAMIPETALLRDPVFLFRDDEMLLEQLDDAITECGWIRKVKTTSQNEMS